MKVSAEQLGALEPYLNGAVPDERGEVELLCPLHRDSRRSAALNVEKGVWYCHAGCGGGSVRQLVEARDAWKPLDDRTAAATRKNGAARSPVVEARPTKEQVYAWHEKLMGDPDAMLALHRRRGLEMTTMKRAVLGWTGRHYKIPVFDADREVANVRTYDMNAPSDRRKIWSVRGCGAPALYPIGVLERGPREILWCEGEWDALLALQVGAAAVTRTGSAKSWRPEWDLYFDGARVFLCHDADVIGEAGNALVGGALETIAADVLVCHLPYPIKEKGGKDLSDFLLEANNPKRALARLMKEATPWGFN